MDEEAKAQARSLKRFFHLIRKSQPASYRSLKRLIAKRQIDINVRGPHQNSPLNMALVRGNEDIIEHFLDLGANVHKVDSYGYTPLMMAVRKRSPPCVIQKLIEKGAQITTVTVYRMTPLMLAARCGFGEVVTCLLKYSPGPGYVNSMDQFGNTALTYAVKQGHLTIVQELVVQGGADINKKNKTGFTPVHYAILGGQYPIVRYFMRYKNSIEKVDGHSRSCLLISLVTGYTEISEYILDSKPGVMWPDEKKITPLTKAVARNYKDAVQRILKAGATPNVVDRKRTSPLTTAVRYNRLDLMLMLLRKGASRNRPERYGRTPLMIAIRNRHSALAIRLIESGCILTKKDRFGGTALSMAAASGDFEVVKTILRYGFVDAKLPVISAESVVNAFTVALENEHWTVARALRNLPGVDWDAFAQMDSSRARLTSAIVRKHTRGALFAIECGADVDVRSPHGNPPVLLAIRYDLPEVFERLLAAGCDLELTNSEERTPLHYAVQMGRREAVRRLLECGACPNTLDKFGYSYLQTAIQHHYNDCAQLLVLANCDVNHRDPEGNTALMTALSFKYEDGEELYRFILEHGEPDVNIPNNNGDYPLKLAIINGFHDTARQLLQMGADPEMRDKDGNTPLILSVIYNRPEVTKILIEHRVSLNEENGTGETALTVALWLGNPGIFELLLNAGAKGHRRNSKGFSAVDVLLQAGLSGAMDDLSLSVLAKFIGKSRLF